MRPSNGGFAFHEALFSTFNRSNQVGNDRVRCHPTPQRKFKCKGYIHLNGEVGGAGFLRVNGNFGHGDRRLNITAGTASSRGRRLARRPRAFPAHLPGALGRG